MTRERCSNRHHRDFGGFKNPEVTFQGKALLPTSIILLAVAEARNDSGRRFLTDIDVVSTVPNPLVTQEGGGVFMRDVEVILAVSHWWFQNWRFQDPEVTRRGVWGWGTRAKIVAGRACKGYIIYSAITRVLLTSRRPGPTCCRLGLLADKGYHREGGYVICT